MVLVHAVGVRVPVPQQGNKRKIYGII